MGHGKEFTCGCCSEKFSLIRREVHHKCPRFLGGSDDPDNLIELCESCHHLIHRTSESLFKGINPSEFLSDYFKGIKSKIDRCLELAGIIVVAKRDNEGAHREFSQPIVPIEFEYYNSHVKDAARASGMTIAEFMAAAVVEKTNNVLGLSNNNTKKRSSQSTARKQVRY